MGFSTMSPYRYRFRQRCIGTVENLNSLTNEKRSEYGELRNPHLMWAVYPQTQFSFSTLSHSPPTVLLVYRPLPYTPLNRRGVMSEVDSLLSSVRLTAGQFLTWSSVTILPNKDRRKRVKDLPSIGGGLVSQRGFPVDT